MIKRSKIVFIAGNIPLPTRKSNKVIIDLAEKLSGGYNVSIVFPKEFCPFPVNMMKKFRYIGGIPKHWTDNGISIDSVNYLRLPGKALSFAFIDLSWKRLISLIKKEKPALLHAHYTLPDGYMAMMASKELGIPYIISFRKSDVENIKKAVFDKKKFEEALRRASTVIVHNKYQQDFLRNNYNIDSQLIPHGIESSFIKERQLAAKNEIVISTVGSMIRSKRFDWVVRAVKNYTGDKKVCLRIIGDGPMMEELKAQAANAMNHATCPNSGIDEYLLNNVHIQFYGWLSHEKVGVMLEESDIFALPSAIETFGLVYMEAAAKMNAVLAVRNTGIWGNFIENEEMLYIDNYEEFQTSLYRLIDNDGVRISLAENAFRRVREEYSWDKIISRYSQLYDKYISQNKQD